MKYIILEYSIRLRAYIFNGRSNSKQKNHFGEYMERFTKFSVFLFCYIIILISGSYPQQVFEVNLNIRADDKFHVTLYPEKLSKENDIFQFASIAPGTYEIMDIGRFVSDFKVYDINGNEITAEHSSTNQWTISDPESVNKITYKVADIWDTPVTEHQIYQMCSSTISDDFVMINGQAVFGYFTGMQSTPIKIKIDYPSDWLVGTALLKDTLGYYLAETYDKVVDSPFYLGALTKASIEVGGADVNVYTYSKTGLIKSNDILDIIRDLLQAESDFTKGLPVDHYTFLFHFGDFSAGAWEHSYSSGYVLQEEKLSGSAAATLKSFVAHEFFHVNLPLNIHSELVEKFNFARPVMSQHLWLYEGVTEWASHILQLRDSLITLQDYIATLSGKLKMNDNFNQSISLTDLGVNATEMPDQYINIYMKGAIIAGLLDLRLLKLSEGKKGLREIIIELSQKYGPGQSFSENNFFNELINMTYPEISDFIERYIKGTDKLPLEEYYKYVGLTYKENAGFDSSKTSLGISLGGSDGTLKIVSVKYKDSGLMAGDIIEKVNGDSLTFQNVHHIFNSFHGQTVGEKVKFTVKRQNQEMEIAETLRPVQIKHKFTVDPDPTSEQLKLRNVWMKNL